MTSTLHRDILYHSVDFIFSSRPSDSIFLFINLFTFFLVFFFPFGWWWWAQNEEQLAPPQYFWGVVEPLDVVFITFLNDAYYTIT